MNIINEFFDNVIQSYEPKFKPVIPEWKERLSPDRMTPSPQDESKEIILTQEDEVIIEHDEFYYNEQYEMNRRMYEDEVWDYYLKFHDDDYNGDFL